MTVLENLMVENHFQGSVENNSLTLGLPELDIEAVFFIPDPPESFSNFSRLAHSKGLRCSNICICRIRYSTLPILLPFRILLHLWA
jgi:hypothetical protein